MRNTILTLLPLGKAMADSTSAGSPGTRLQSHLSR